MRSPLLALALLLHALFAGAFLVRTPAFEGPDENDHCYYAFHLAHTHTLPIVWKSMELTGEPAWKNAALGHHPPLYYAILAGAMTALGHADTTPSWQPAGVPGALRWRHGFDERSPVSREVWLLRALRAFSLLCGLATLVLVHRIGRVVFPERPAIADLAAVCLACLPQWGFMHGVLDNGNLAATLAHAALWILVLALRDERLSLARGLALGAVIGLALLTKLTTLALLPLAGIAWIWLLVRARERRAETARSGIAGALLAAALAGWFFVRNARLYGDLLATRAHEAAFADNRVPQALLDAPWTYWPAVARRLLHSFCGEFGWMSAPVPDLVFWIVAALLVLALAGWLIARPRLSSGAIVTLLATWLVLASVLHFNRTFIQPQGRYLFPAAGPMMLWFAGGLVMLGVPRVLLLVASPISTTLVIALCFWPRFDARLAPADAWHASLVAGLRQPGRVALSAEAPANGERCAGAPTFRFSVPAGEPAGARYTIHAWTRGGRILFATYEWAGLALAPGEFVFPEPFWQQLPRDEEIVWRVRRIADRERGEDVREMPVSEERGLVRVR